MKTTSRVHILSTVNAANVSKAGAQYTVRDVCAAVDEIVMNGMLYPGDQLAAGAKSLEGKPAPAGHPKDAAGNHISATSGDALLTAFAGAICRNARHEGGRTLVDIVVNESQALAHPDGAKLVARLNDAISGSNAEPIHVSTGVLVRPITANGESRGKRYTRIATDPQYDHLAFLLHERGAGTPEEGVGMFLNADGQPAEVEAVALNTEPEDRRTRGLMAWVMRLLGNSAGDLSFDQIQSGLYKALGDGAWLQEVFDRYAVWADRDGKLYRQDYSVSSSGSVAWSGTAQEVTRRVEYEPVANRQEIDTVKELLIAALNAVGIKTEGMADAALLAAYNAHVEAAAKAPIETKLNAATAKVAEFEANARAAEDAERLALSTELAANSLLTVDDLKALPVERLRALKTARGTSAAPVLPAGTKTTESGQRYAGYSLNSFIDDKAAA